jgi:hypothetical protein
VDAGVPGGGRFEQIAAPRARKHRMSSRRKRLRDRRADASAGAGHDDGSGVAHGLIQTGSPIAT